MTTNHTPTADYPGSGEHVEILLRQRAELVAALHGLLRAPCLHEDANSNYDRKLIRAAQAALAKVTP